MDDITTRTIIIAVNIFITITIVSLLIVMFFQMGEIYGMVADTDTSIYSKFDDVYSMYNGKVETGIGLLNAIKKQEDSQESYIVLKYPKSEELREEIRIYNATSSEENKKRESTELKEIMQTTQNYKGEIFKYENKYNVTVSEGENGTLIVEFIKIGK